MSGNTPVMPMEEREMTEREAYQAYNEATIQAWYDFGKPTKPMKRRPSQPMKPI